MARDSNVHSVVVASGGGGSTTLAQLVGGMASNSWAQLDCPSLTRALVDPFNDSSAITYLGRGCADPVHDRIVCACQAHGAVGFSTNLVYTFSTNVWINDTPPPNLTVTHGYFMNAVNPTNGDHYWHDYFSHVVRRRSPWNGSWANVASDNLPNTEYSVCLEWSTAFNGGAGGLVTGNRWGVSLSNPAVSSWTLIGNGIVNGGNLFLGAGGGAGALNSVDNSVLMVGGQANLRSVVRISTTGVCTQLGDTPVDCQSPGNGNTDGLTLPGVGGQGPIIFRLSGGAGTSGGNGAMYRFNTGAGTWSQMSSTCPVIASGGVWFGTAVPSIGGNTALACYVFVYQVTAETPDNKMWVYKP